MNMATSIPTLKERAQRFPFNVPLHYRRIDDTVWHECTTINVSRTGILFEAGESLEKNIALDIQVQFPLKKILHCQGRVIRSENHAHAVRIYHCQFRNVTD
jgi:hypothetical protein